MIRPDQIYCVVEPVDMRRGAFIWPSHDDRCWVMTQAQWDWLIKGVDWQRLTVQAPAHWRV